MCIGTQSTAMWSWYKRWCLCIVYRISSRMLSRLCCLRRPRPTVTMSQLFSVETSTHCLSQVWFAADFCILLSFIRKTPSPLLPAFVDEHCCHYLIACQLSRNCSALLVRYHPSHSDVIIVTLLIHSWYDATRHLQVSSRLGFCHTGTLMLWLA